MEVEEGKATAGVDASETVELDLRGENKAPVSKRSRRKKKAYKTKNAERKTKQETIPEKQKPRYFCKF